MQHHRMAEKYHRELMRLYSTEPEFHIPEELQQQIQEVKMKSTGS